MSCPVTTVTYRHKALSASVPSALIRGGAPPIVDCSFSDENEVARAHGDRVATVSKKSSSVLVDPIPGSFDQTLSDDTLNTIAGLVNRVPAPFLEHLFAFEC